MPRVYQCIRSHYVVSVKPKHSIRVYLCPSVAQKTKLRKLTERQRKQAILATDGHGYTRMRIAGFLALHREKIGTKLYGYVLAKRRREVDCRCKAHRKHVAHRILIWSGHVAASVNACRSRSVMG